MRMIGSTPVVYHGITRHGDAMMRGPVVGGEAGGRGGLG